MKLRRLVLLYGVFAAAATAVNLLVQRGVLLGGRTAPWLAAAIAAGTVAGLVVKYLLDKRWIFADRSTGLRAHGERFSRYTAMGLVTTAIFWGMETAAWALWHTDAMREAGALAGLLIGYVVKYRLDRRFVFTPG